ncbi:MAG: cytochrome c oxidase subunit 3 [Bacteroidota bacterium]
MESNMRIVEEARKPVAMNPKKFALWLFMGSVVMIFAAFTSYYIVRQADGGWTPVQLPDTFLYNTVIIILSSLVLHWAYISAKKNELGQVKIGVILASVLGVAFLVGQFWGWSDLVAINVHFVSSDSLHSMIYVLTLVHGAHLVSGVVVLGILLVKTLRFKIHSKNMTTMEMSVTYWHFLGGLWLYLFVFLLVNN